MQLWSFFIARSDVDASGTYSPAERRSILAAFGHSSPTSPRGIDVPHALRTSSAEAATRNAQLGLPNPLETVFQFTSHDGYAYTNTHMAPGSARGDKPIWPVTADESRRAGPVCTLQLEFCFGRAFLEDDHYEMSVADVFRQIAYDKPQCGDCIIALLVSKSGPKGLEAFLPPPDEQARSEPEADGEPAAIGLSSKKWRDLVLEQPQAAFGSRRQQVSRPDRIADREKARRADADSECDRLPLSFSATPTVSATRRLTSSRFAPAETASRTSSKRLRT